jgi:hypothetical protein
MPVYFVNLSKNSSGSKAAGMERESTLFRILGQIAKVPLASFRWHIC